MTYTVFDTKTETSYGGFQTIDAAENFMRDRFDELYFYHYDPDGYRPQYNDDNIMVAIVFVINEVEYSLSIEEVA